MSDSLHWSLKISRCFGASPMTYNCKNERLIFDQAAVPKVNRNFTLASIWFVLALIVVFKRYQNKDNLDQFHLTLAWWLGYMLVLMVFSISKFYTPEFCDSGNGATNIFRLIHGNFKQTY